MFASRIANKFIYDTLSSTPGVTNVVTAIVRGLGYPPNVEYPACLFYMEAATYDSGQLAHAEHIDGEQMRFVVQVDDKGTSDVRIAPAAQAQLEALAGTVTNLDDGTQITFHATGEVPVTSYVDGGEFYQRLGTIYTVDVTRG